MVECGGLDCHGRPAVRWHRLDVLAQFQSCQRVVGVESRCGDCEHGWDLSASACSADARRPMGLCCPELLSSIGHRTSRPSRESKSLCDTETRPDMGTCAILVPGSGLPMDTPR